MTQEEAAFRKERQDEEDRKDHHLHSEDLMISNPKDDENDYLATGIVGGH